jgi:DNA-binding NarL/FixJ family response regulator
MGVCGVPTRVLFLDENPLVGGSITAPSEGAEPLVTQEHDARHVLSEDVRGSADVVLLDADLIGSELPSLVNRIKASAGDSKVLVLTSVEELDPIVDAIEAGASGCLPKKATIWDLLEATRNVCLGHAILPPKMVGPMIAVLADRQAVRDEALEKVSSLTRREREVLLLLADGLDRDAIAGKLVISPRTVTMHVHRVLAKLGVHSRLQGAALVQNPSVLSELEAVSTER